MSATSFLQSQLVNAVLANGTYTGPEDLYVALLNTNQTELGGLGYSRQLVQFNIPSGESFGTNTAALEFGAATEDWAAVRYWRVVDASTAGNVLFQGQFTSDQTVLADSTLVLEEGAVVITFS
jgi:hypothetical protein